MFPSPTDWRVLFKLLRAWQYLMSKDLAQEISEAVEIPVNELWEGSMHNVRNRIWSKCKVVLRKQKVALWCFMCSTTFQSHSPKHDIIMRLPCCLGGAHLDCFLQWYCCCGDFQVSTLLYTPVCNRCRSPAHGGVRLRVHEKGTGTCRTYICQSLCSLEDQEHFLLHCHKRKTTIANLWSMLFYWDKNLFSVWWPFKNFQSSWTLLWPFKNFQSSWTLWWPFKNFQSSWTLHITFTPIRKKN